MHPAKAIFSAFTRLLLFGLVLTSLARPDGASAQARDVVVFAAASLKNALDDAGAAWTRQTGRRVVASYAASNALARQIEAGAPADIFFSADLDWMDYASARGLIKPESRISLLGNALVLVAPKGSTAQVALQPGLDLAPLLGGGRLAMGHVDAVPAGKYGKAALEHLGAWAGVKDKIAQTDNVRAALLLVSRGEAPLGIVYRTDAVSDPNVTIAGTFPDSSHPPIVYPVALTKDTTSADAATFLAFLRSDTIRPYFERQGFTILSKPGSPS
jgi:molybdate transport system substrate-binding protein